MLTATYSIVAISTEQKKVCSVLQNLKGHIHDALEEQSEVDISRIQTALDQLSQFEQHCHSRKVEKILIPAVRGSCREIDGLVEELETISARAIDLLRSAQDQLRQAFDVGVVRLSELCDAMAYFCDSLLKRFAREEEELLPLAMRLLSIDKWFDIAAELLSEDERQPKKERAGSTALLMPV